MIAAGDQDDSDADALRPCSSICSARALLAPGDAQHPTGAETYSVGDKVMQAENDKDMYNGDLGFIRRIDAEPG